MLNLPLRFTTHYSGLLQHTADEFCKISRMDFGVIPGVTLSSGPVEPYNAVLATQVPVEHVNLVSLVDNMALQRICFCLLKIIKPSFTSLNRIIAQVSHFLRVKSTCAA